MRATEIARLRGTHFDPEVADALLVVIRRETGAEADAIPVS